MSFERRNALKAHYVILDLFVAFDNFSTVNCQLVILNKSFCKKFSSLFENKFNLSAKEFHTSETKEKQLQISTIVYCLTNSLRQLFYYLLTYMPKLSYF